MTFTRKQKEEYRKQRRETEDALKTKIQDIATAYKESPEKLADFFSFSARFHNYSPRNVMLIRDQNPGAMLCKPFVLWKDEGVQVKKGERGMKIFVPAPITYIETGSGEEVAFSQATSAQQEAYKKGELPGRQKMAYKVGHVFDIAQTDFPPEEYPKLLSVGVSSVPHRQLPTAKAYGLAEARQGRCKSPG